MRCMKQFSLTLVMLSAPFCSILIAGCSDSETSKSGSADTVPLAVAEEPAPGPAATSYDLAGSWSGRLEYSVEDIAKMKAANPYLDVNMTIANETLNLPSFEIRDDGTYTMTTMGIEFEGEWTVDGDELLLAVGDPSTNENLEGVADMAGVDGSNEPMRLLIAEDGTELWLLDLTGESTSKVIYTRE